MGKEPLILSILSIEILSITNWLRMSSLLNLTGNFTPLSNHLTPLRVRHFLAS
uniref:Uncharacterized protein n=1 Tax=Picea glauca TaxID=3330 RepID=A0A101LZR4_PICGL|nr:hypothetical protein ABT39_MTgene5379 [Picea glauca]